MAFRIEYTFTPTGTTRWVRVVALVPKSLPRRQIVHEVAFSPEPVRLYEAADRRYAEFLFSGVAQKLTVTIAGRARLLRYDLATARRLGRPERSRGGQPADAHGLRPHLIDEPSLEKDDPAVAAVAKSIQGADELDTIRKIYAFVLDHMEFGGVDLSSGSGAVKALKNGKGDCTEYTDLLVALCRAKGIPARHVLGLLALPSNPVPQHSWAEVHTADHGWVRLDPMVDDTSDNASFERLGPNYLHFSSVRNDARLENYHAFAAYRWWGARVELSETYDIRPLAAAEGR